MNFDNVPEQKTISNKQPRLKQLFLNMAVKSLSKKQQEMWFLWNNERLSQDQLAKVFGVTQQAINKKLNTIETKLKKWCDLNKGAYLLLKLEHKIMNEETE